MENKEVNRQHKRGLWKPEEDLILKNYVETHGEGNWADMSKKSGLMRGGKSCRLRWKNYLRPNIKRGEISKEEEDLIIRMHKLLGNRWSLIAGRLPGRTDNEVKNYWNTHLNKKCRLGKRKATEPGKLNGDNDNNVNSSSSNKLPRLCDSQSVRSTSMKGKAEGLDEREEKKVQEGYIANTWTDDNVGSFNYDIECSLLSPDNAFVFDDEPFNPYLNSFLLFENFECYQ